MIERLRDLIPAGTAGEFYSHDLAFCADSYSVSVPVDPVLGHHTSRERQPAAGLELPNDQLHQTLGQSHAEDHTEQVEATSGEDHRQRTGRPESRKEYHRADLQPTHSV